MALRSKKAFDPTAFLSKVRKGKSVASYRRGEVLYAQDDPADKVYFVEQGKVTLSIHSKKGHEALLGILGPGNFFGLGGVQPNTRRIMTATALSDCRVIGLTSAAMSRLLRTQPALNTSEKRLARALLVLTNFGQDGGGATALSGMSQEMLADMIGTTRARVSHFMNKFRRQGYIEYNGEIRVNPTLRNVFLE